MQIFRPGTLLLATAGAALITPAVASAQPVPAVAPAAASSEVSYLAAAACGQYTQLQADAV